MKYIFSMKRIYENLRKIFSRENFHESIIKNTKEKIAIKLGLIIISVVFIVSIISNIYFINTYSRTLKVSLEDSINDVYNFSMYSLGYSLWTLDSDAIDNLSKTILKSNNLIAVNIYDNQNILLHSEMKSPINIKENISSHNEPLKPDPGNPYIITKKAAVKYNNTDVGSFELFFSTKQVEEEKTAAIAKLILIFLIIAVSIVLIIYLGINKYAIKPIFNLAGLIKQVADTGNYTLRIASESEDEIGDLYKGFNYMLEQVESRDMERDKVEQVLKHTQNFLNNVINSMPSMLISVDENNIVNQWNQAAVEYTGINAIDAIGKNLWEMTDEFDRYKGYCSEIIEKRESMEFPKEVFKNNINELRNVTLFPLIANGIKGLVIRIDDITELEKKEQQLRQAQKMETIGTLAGGLAHDFNNVLGGIIGSISLMKFRLNKDDLVDKTVIGKFLNTMEYSGQRASDIVQSLLALSRKHELTLAPLDLNETIKNVVRITENSFDKSIEIRVEYQPEPAYVNADLTQLEQVVLNLCINASHAMTIMKSTDEKQGGILSIRLEKFYADREFRAKYIEAESREYWRLMVKDTGIGMDQNVISKIFEPFFTTKEKGKGSGLGLSMVYNIINQHNGFIDINSELGKGSEFSIILPVLKNVGELEKKRIIEKIIKGDGVILIVDDEGIMRQMAAEILTTAGYSVLIAHNGVEGVEIFREKHREIKAVLLDMVMPEKSGQESYIEMKEIDRNVKVVLTSGFRKDERVEEVLNLGVKKFIQKPYTLETLTHIFAEILKED